MYQNWPQGNATFLKHITKLLLYLVKDKTYLEVNFKLKTSFFLWFMIRVRCNVEYSELSMKY